LSPPNTPKISIRITQWAALTALTALLVLGLQAVKLPASVLLGAMIAAIVLAARQAAIRMPERVFAFCQAVIGCLMARSFPPSILPDLLRNGPIFLIGVAAVILASAALGWLLARTRVLPGTSAVWGSSPGAAMAMTLMAAEYGADVRLVAFMQYLRVVCVAIVASVVAGLLGGSGGPEVATALFPPVAWAHFAGTCALVAAGTLLGPRRPVPAGALLIPLVLGAVLHGTGVLRIELPPWLLLTSYALVGWGIGLRFDRQILLHAARALPRVLASILILLAICGLFAAGLVVFVGVDPLTAYLATTPGGADSVAIIAASSGGDVSFVMTMQTVRFLAVLVTGPGLAKFIARRLGGPKNPG
jgi:membrane AbrB-like protein